MRPISVFDLFKIGIGPSSSHTLGPMVIARRFAGQLEMLGHLPQTTRIRIELYGSLALTGIGHGTDRAVILGLLGEEPQTIDSSTVPAMLERVRTAKRLTVLGRHEIGFDEKTDLDLRGDLVPEFHPNGMRLFALAEGGACLHAETFYSIGGGFVVSEHEASAGDTAAAEPERSLPYPFETAADLLRIGRDTGLAMHEIVLANEAAWRPEGETLEGLDRIWAVMDACIERGLTTEGTLPGGLRVVRRAPGLKKRLLQTGGAGSNDPERLIDWLNLYAFAVNEENAAGGQVVTAPTNGAAGILPAVLRYHMTQGQGTEESRRRFLLAAGGIGSLYKAKASISGAEMGCQGEVGVACSMAAGGLAAALGGTNLQIECAAEIGMEHNLGLTCDPVGGLVQIPCIERNALGAVKALNAARLAMNSEGHQRVSLDQVIETMRQTGADMNSKYKETSQGGLAVNVTEC